MSWFWIYFDLCRHETHKLRDSTIVTQGIHNSMVLLLNGKPAKYLPRETRRKRTVPAFGTCKMDYIIMDWISVSDKVHILSHLFNLLLN